MKDWIKSITLTGALLFLILGPNASVSIAEGTWDKGTVVLNQLLANCESPCTECSASAKLVNVPGLGHYALDLHRVNQGAPGALVDFRGERVAFHSISMTYTGTGISATQVPIIYCWYFHNPGFPQFVSFAPGSSNTAVSEKDGITTLSSVSDADFPSGSFLATIIVGLSPGEEDSSMNVVVREIKLNGLLVPEAKIYDLKPESCPRK
ncbi:MAG TPA: hypothetical protein V6C81_23670 [Planktothrix sp.]|jgi:hypothetical protein